MPGNSNQELPASMKVTEFMLNLMKQIVEHRKVTESTATAYIKTLYMLNDKEPFKTLTFLKKTDELEKKIAEYAETTQRSIFTSITSVLSIVKDKPTFKKTYAHYYERMMGKAKDLKSDTDDAKKTEKQKDAWIEWKDVEAKLKELHTKVAEFGSAKTLTSAQYETLLKYVILALYTYHQPRRNQDYMDMYVATKWTAESPKDKNYLVMSGKTPQKFVFNKFKTQKTYGQQVIPIENTAEKPLADCIATYLKHHPLVKGNKSKTAEYKFLVNYDGTPLSSVNAITRILNKIFSKKIGSSMLRHIYLSSKYDIGDMEKDATAMGHSLEEQRKYLKEKDPKPPSV